MLIRFTDMNGNDMAIAADCVKVVGLAADPATKIIMPGLVLIQTNLISPQGFMAYTVKSSVQDLIDLVNNALGKSHHTMH